MKETKHYLIWDLYNNGDIYTIFCSEKVSKLINREARVVDYLKRTVEQIYLDNNYYNKETKKYKIKIITKELKKNIYLKVKGGTNEFYAFTADENDFVKQLEWE